MTTTAPASESGAADCPDTARFRSPSRLGGAGPCFTVPSRLLGPGGHAPGAGEAAGPLQGGATTTTVISAADAVLKGDPLNADALSYKGFASFYRAASQNALEEKMPYLDQSIVSLRRARLVGHAFQRGRQTTSWARPTSTRASTTTTCDFLAWKARSQGLRAEGLLRVHRPGLHPARGLREGDGALPDGLKDDSGDLLLLTIGQTYYQMKRTSDAIDYLLRTLNKTEDKEIEERARFLFGGIYLDTERAVQGGGAVRGDREDRPPVGGRALRPRRGVCEDERPGESAGGVAQCADHRSVALRRQAPLLPRAAVASAE